MGRGSPPRRPEQEAFAARCGDDTYMPTAQAGGAAAELDQGEKFFKIPCEHYPRASEEVFLNKGGTCERPCVCERGSSAEARYVRT